MSVPPVLPCIPALACNRQVMPYMIRNVIASDAEVVIHRFCCYRTAPLSTSTAPPPTHEPFSMARSESASCFYNPHAL